MKPGDIIQAKTSKCCGTSIYPVNGKTNEKGEFIPRHYVCNKCGNPTEKILKNMWVVTDNFKYKLLTPFNS